jgi:hypothetical protein
MRLPGQVILELKGKKMQTVIHSVSTASEVIQLAIAPVFLLMGVSALLGVLTGRLGRVVDRFRVLNEKYGSAQKDAVDAKIWRELHLLQRRAIWVHRAITLSTLSLLFVAIVIGMLFLGEAIRWDSSWLVSPLFFLAMLSLVAGLCCFLCEIYLSKHTFELPKRKLLKTTSK